MKGVLDTCCLTTLAFNKATQKGYGTCHFKISLYQTKENFDQTRLD